MISAPMLPHDAIGVVGFSSSRLPCQMPLGLARRVVLLIGNLSSRVVETFHWFEFYLALPRFPACRFSPRPCDRPLPPLPRQAEASVAMR